MLLDPARIKRGLAPHREAGYPLVEGVDVELVVDGGFRDARGAPLNAAFVQRYRVGPDLRSIVEPSVGRSTSHRPGRVIRSSCTSDDRSTPPSSRGACSSSTARELHSMVRPRSAPRSGPGRSALRPRGQPNAYELVVDAVIEDVAGNSVARVFDRDLTEPAHAPRAVDRVQVPFVPA